MEMKMILINILKPFLIFSFLVVLNGCITDVPFHPSKIETRLVIEGQITNDPGPYTITVMYSGDFSQSDVGIPTPVSDARVKLFSNTGEQAELLEYSAGIYKTLEGEIQGEIGKSYFIEVSIGESVYQSVPEELLPVEEIDDIYFTSYDQDFINSTNNISTRHYAKFLVNTTIPDNEENVFFKWNFTGDFFYEESPTITMSPQVCYVHDQIGLNQIAIFGDKTLAGKPLLNQEIYNFQLTFEFSFIYLLRVSQQSLTKDAYKFWSQVKSIVDRSGSLFEKPPGRVKGNIFNLNDPNEEVLGYFSASAITYKTLLIPAFEIEGSPQRCGSALSADVDCYFCNRLAGASSSKPSYWP